MVAESSVVLCSTLGNMLNTLVLGCNSNAQIDEKLNDFKKDLLEDLEARGKDQNRNLMRSLMLFHGC